MYYTQGMSSDPTGAQSDITVFPFLFLFSYSKGCTRIVGYQRQQWWEIPTLSEAQVMSQSKIFQIPGHKTVVLFVFHST